MNLVNIKTIAVRLCLLSAFLCATVSLRAQDAMTAKFQLLRTGHQAVSVRINGKGPYRMIFDTGAPASEINPAVAQALGLTGVTTEITVELGGAKADIPVTVHEHSIIKSVKQQHPDIGAVDGLLGFVFFARFRTTLDYQRGEITFRPGNYDPGDPMQKMVDRRLGDTGKTKKPIARAIVLGLNVNEPGETARGVRIDSVLAGSCADAAGLRKGDWIVGLNEWWIEDVRDFHDAIASLVPASTARLKILRDGKLTEMQVQTRPGL